MHVSGFPHLLPFDLYPLLQFVFTAVVIAVAILHLVKSTASRYFVVDASFEERGEDSGGAASAAVDREGGMGASVAADDASGGGCAVCGSSSSKRCMGCLRVIYCSKACQSEHWRAGHKRECRRKSDATVGDHGSSYDSKHSKVFPQLEKVLFPYEDFVKLFNWGNMKISPCGLLNCGNSCYANVVLQCLSTTRPLVAYLLEVRHARKCRRNDWCFLCELEAHVDRATHSCQPFSPINILSRLPNIGGNLGYGKQEDAHEFMRFAIDTMQSVCLDEFGGEKAIHPSSQETTLIQYIFGGQLQSQVKCSKCRKISYRHENMMDLTVEIQGDAESLEKCLDQFTAEEWLDGENMYKCDGCNDYVKACKRLAIHQAPNILTIALKRFQSGRFGKLNKRVTFPETLDLSPYMSEPGYGSDIYRLYAVVVHIDMLNASYFGHYICYVKDFCGNWYRIDDCKVETVELEEVLSQGAYMLLYSRISVRPSCVKPPQIHKEENQKVVDMVEEDQPCTTAVDTVAIESVSTVGIVPADVGLPVGVEKQQEKNVSEETQPCSPVFESVDVEACSSLSTMTTDAGSPTEISTSNKFDVGLMNVDDSVKVDSRILENATASTADVLFDSKSSSMDMDLDTPNKFDQMLSRGDEMDIDSGNPDPGSLRVKVNECGTSQSDGQSARNLGGVLGSVPLRETTLVEDRSLDCQLVSCSNSEGQSSEETNTTRAEVSSTVSNLPQSGICELADSSCSPTVILHGNSSDNTTKPLAGFSSSISEKNTAKPARDESCSNGKQKPMFSVGFLDKRPKRNTPNKKGTVLEKPGEVGIPCNVSSNCNVITKPDPQNRNGTVLAKPGEVVMPGNVSRNCNGITKPALSQGNNVDHGHNGSCSDEHNSIFVPGFLDKRNRRGSQNGNGNTIVKPSDVGVPCKPHSKCNGFTNNSQGIKVVHEDNVSSQNGNGKPSDVGVPCKPHSKCNGFTNNSQGIKVVHEDNVSSQNGNGNILVKPGEVGESCKLGRNCNGFTIPIASQSIHMVHDGNGISEHENGNILVKPGEAGTSCRLDSDCNGSTKPTASGNVSVVHHGNGTFNSECQHSPRRPTFVGEVGSSWEASNFNGSANSGSLHKSREDHNNDRNSEYHKLEDQCDDIIIDDGGQEDDEGSRKFLNNLSAKKSLKKECRSLSDYHNCNKFPRVG